MTARTAYAGGMKRPLGALFVGLVMTLGLLAGCESDPSDKDIEYISLGELRTLLEGKDASKTLLVDPRAPQDYDAGHIPGAQNYGINSERAKTGGGLNPVFKGYKHLIVYGDNPSPGPAQAMAKRLMYMKADNVRVFGGGMMEWRRAGLSVEKSDTKAAAEEQKKSGTLGK